MAYYVTATLLDPDHGNKAVIGGSTTGPVRNTAERDRNRNWIRFESETEAESFAADVRNKGRWPF